MLVASRVVSEIRTFTGCVVDVPVGEASEWLDVFVSWAVEGKVSGAATAQVTGSDIAGKLASVACTMPNMADRVAWLAWLQGAPDKPCEPLVVLPAYSGPVSIGKDGRGVSHAEDSRPVTDALFGDPETLATLRAKIAAAWKARGPMARKRLRRELASVEASKVKSPGQAISQGFANAMACVVEASKMSALASRQARVLSCHVATAPLAPLPMREDKPPATEALATRLTAQDDRPTHPKARVFSTCTECGAKTLRKSGMCAECEASIADLKEV